MTQDDRLYDHRFDTDPDPAEWLEMDEGERIAAVEEAHELDAPADHPVPGGGWRLHASMHVVVENQLAANEPPETRETLDRLVAAGVSRHSAVHAVASVVGVHLQRALADRQMFDQAAYVRDLDGLDPRDW